VLPNKNKNKKNPEHLKEKLGGSVCDLGLGIDFLDITPNHNPLKKRIIN
jgi:hypothetical protein